jgi:uncharacterized oxidoreductase
MEMQSNTILITGGTSGIGQGLAEALYKLGNQVIITGRREENLHRICAANPGMRFFALDVTNPQSILHVAKKATVEFPNLNCVINNAGVQNMPDLSAGRPLDEKLLLEELNTNILGLIRVGAAFTAHLAGRPNATLINVSSGLAFVPLARFPVYCATKAFVHSFTMSLRYQLRGKGIRVVELIPPYVATELGGPSKGMPPPGAPQPMLLADFISETMKALATDADELAIGEAKNLAAAGGLETQKKAFGMMNR